MIELVCNCKMNVRSQYCCGAIALCVLALGMEAGSEMSCDNSQRAPAKYKCIFEYDEYGIQKGCRDMSHLQGCGEYLVLPRIKGCD